MSKKVNYKELLYVCQLAEQEMKLKHFFCLSSFCNFYDISMNALNFSAVRVFHKFSLYIPRSNAEIFLGNAVPGDSSTTLRTYLQLVTKYDAVECDCEVKLTSQQLWKKWFIAGQAMYV